MPNWCEGTLKVRGEFADVKRWVEENLSVYRMEIENGKINQIKDIDGVEVIDYDGEEIEVNVKETAHIKGTRRHFVQQGVYITSGCSYYMVLCMKFKAAWEIDAEPFVEMSREYNVDFRLYGCERGEEFSQEIIVEKGEIADRSKTHYTDYVWDCPFPNLGG